VKKRSLGIVFVLQAQSVKIMELDVMEVMINLNKYTKNRLSGIMKKKSNKLTHEEGLLLVFGSSGFVSTALIFLSFFACLIAGLDDDFCLRVIVVGSAGWFLSVFLYVAFSVE
jgi:hypothetical protein